MPVKNDENMTESDKKGQLVNTGRSSAATEPTKSEAKTREVPEEVKPQFYVWLANGEVLRAYEEDLPGASGLHNPHGHWEKDGNVYQVVAVYPVEEKADQ